MITVVKLSPQGEALVRYQGELIEQLPDGVVIQATWTNPTRELGYTRFEIGDRFTEYYFTARWFNIFAIASANGIRKGWYCNVAEPAHIYEDRIEQVDLLLDVWVDADGTPLILDEDEFAADLSLTAEQRSGAQRGLAALLQLVTARAAPFQQ